MRFAPALLPMVLEDMAAGDADTPAVPLQAAEDGEHVVLVRRQFGSAERHHIGVASGAFLCVARHGGRRRLRRELRQRSAACGEEESEYQADGAKHMCLLAGLFRLLRA
jgi:hypothetical protein